MTHFLQFLRPSVQTFSLGQLQFRQRMELVQVLERPIHRRSKAEKTGLFTRRADPIHCATLTCSRSSLWVFTSPRPLRVDCRAISC